MKNISKHAATLSLLMCLSTLCGCGVAMDEEGAEIDGEEEIGTASQAVIISTECNLDQLLTATPGTTKTWQIEPKWGSPSCPLPTNATRMWAKVVNVNMGSCGGTDCPYVQVLTPTGDLVKHYSSTSAAQYLKITQPDGTTNGTQSFQVTIYHPTWITSYTSSVTVQALSW